MALSTKLGEIARESLSGGMVDSAVTLVTGTEQLNVIAATRLAGGDRWEAHLEKNATDLRGNGNSR